MDQSKGWNLGWKAMQRSLVQLQLLLGKDYRKKIVKRGSTIDSTEDGRDSRQESCGGSRIIIRKRMLQ